MTQLGAHSAFHYDDEPGGSLGRGGEGQAAGRRVSRPHPTPTHGQCRSHHHFPLLQLQTLFDLHYEIQVGFFKKEKPAWGKCYRISFGLTILKSRLT